MDSFNSMDDYRTARDALRAAADDGDRLGRWAARQDDDSRNAPGVTRDELALALRAPDTDAAVREWAAEHASEAWSEVPDHAESAFLSSLIRGYRAAT